MKSICPYCSSEHDVHDGATPESRPEPGDISLCWRCLTPATFGEDLELRRLTDEEVDQLRDDPALLSALAAARSHLLPEAAVAEWRAFSRGRQ